MSVMALVVSYVVEEPMRFYARVNPSMTASYQARLCAGRMQADIRDLTDTATVSSMTSTAFTFGDSGGNTVAYSLSGTDLQRNGDLIAQGVTALTFTYWKSDGTTATAAADLHLVEYDFTVQIASQSHRVQGTAFPLSLTPGSSSSSSASSGPLDESASAATAARDSDKKATLDLVSISSSDVEIASFSLSGGSSTEDFHRLKLENDQIYHYHWSSLPLVDLAVNDGSASERTVAAGASPELLLEFRHNQSGTVTYTLDLTFTDAQTATITITINWGGSSDDDDD